MMLYQQQFLQLTNKQEIRKKQSITTSIFFSNMYHYGGTFKFFKISTHLTLISLRN